MTNPIIPEIPDKMQPGDLLILHTEKAVGPVTPEVVLSDSSLFDAIEEFQINLTQNGDRGFTATISIQRTEYDFDSFSIDSETARGAVNGIVWAIGQGLPNLAAEDMERSKPVDIVEEITLKAEATPPTVMLIENHLVSKFIQPYDRDTDVD